MQILTAKIERYFGKPKEYQILIEKDMTQEEFDKYVEAPFDDEEITSHSKIEFHPIGKKTEALRLWNIKSAKFELSEIDIDLDALVDNAIDKLINRLKKKDDED